MKTLADFPPLDVVLEGFDLHAGVAVPTGERTRLVLSGRVKLR